MSVCLVYCPDCIKKNPHKTGHFVALLPDAVVGQTWVAWVRVRSQFCPGQPLFFSSNGITLA